MELWTTKEDYLAALERELRPMDPQERLEALEYYREYLEEAGPERERQAIEGLGPPKELAAQLLAQSAAPPPSGGKWRWLGIASLIGLPVGLALTAAAVAVALAVIVSLAAVLLALYAIAVSLGIAGAASLIAGLLILPQLPFASLTLAGIGIALAGLGGLILIPTHSLTRWLLRYCTLWARRLRARRRGRQDARRDAAQNPAPPPQEEEPQTEEPSAYEMLSRQLGGEEAPAYPDMFRKGD